MERWTSCTWVKDIMRISSFAWLPNWLCMMFFSNIGLGGLIFQTCSSRNPPPLFYHLCSSFSNSSPSFSQCWLYSGFCVPFSFASMVQLMIVVWHGQRWSYQFPIPKADCLFLFFFHLETPKTYIWRLVFIISFAVVYNQSSCVFYSFRLSISLPANSTDICFFDSSTVSWS